MLFSSIPFLYVFLPAVILVYFLVPKALKNTVLLIFSLAFYAWGEPRYVFLMIATIAIFYFCALAIDKSCTQKWKKLWLCVAVAVGLGLLGIFKYADFFIDSFNRATGFRVAFLRLALPVGISFYTFQSLSYVVDVYRGSVPVQKNVINLATYVTLFPQLIAGPIVRYADIARELDQRTHSWAMAAEGIRRFLMGLSKKILLADNFALLAQLFRDSGDKSVVFYWMYGIAFMLNIYFDFSGYSDMAIGLGSVFGFRFQENFNYPYQSKSITEFWRRWHMSLSSWFRDYLYIPLGGNRVSKGRWVFNLFVVRLLAGFWHGANWTFVVWGGLYAAILLIEKCVPAIKRLPSIIRRGCVLLIVMLSFVLFNADSLAQAGQDIGGMFGRGDLPFLSGQTVYYLKSYAFLFILGFVGCTPVVKNAALKIRNTRAGAVLETVVLILLLLVCTACLVDGSFSPFLYFRF